MDGKLFVNWRVASGEWRLLIGDCAIVDWRLVSQSTLVSQSASVIPNRQSTILNRQSSIGNQQSPLATRQAPIE
jgi:hypothetical protein